MQCEMCGKEGHLFCTEVEGTKLDLCKICSKFGKILFSKRPEIKKKAVFRAEKKVEETPEIIEMIIEDYAKKIRNGREKLGLKQVEFAKRLSEKESLIQNIESGKLEPTIALAKKLEKFLKVKLIEEHEEKNNPLLKATKSKAKSDAYTLGDFVRIRKRK